MSKNYFLLFGSKIDEIDIVSTVLAEVLIITFERRDSSYLGNYNRYEGEIVDSLIVESNLYPELKEAKFKEYMTIVKASFVQGSTSEKQLKVEIMKEKVLAKNDIIILLRETIIENNKITEEKIYD